MHEANTFKNTSLSNPIHLFLALRRFGWTLVLFTYTDFKTIVFPVVGQFNDPPFPFIFYCFVSDFIRMRCSPRSIYWTILLRLILDLASPPTGRCFKPVQECCRGFVKPPMAPSTRWKDIHKISGSYALAIGSLVHSFLCSIW
jgi:hypothetical protein